MSGAEHNQLVELVEKGILPLASLPVSLLHDQLGVNLVGQAKDRSDSAVGCIGSEQT